MHVSVITGVNETFPCAKSGNIPSHMIHMNAMAICTSPKLRDRFNAFFEMSEWTCTLVVDYLISEQQCPTQTQVSIVFP